MNDTIQQRIIAHLKHASMGRRAADVRIGLGYTSVRLDNGHLGLAWTAPSGSGHCTHQPRAGSLATSDATSLLEMVADDKHSLNRTVGLATANALIAGLPRPATTKEDILDILNIQAADRVVMVGYFGPLLFGIRQTGCTFDILELDTTKPGTVTMAEGRQALERCTVAIITSTSIVTGTVDELLASFGQPRAAVMLGPSTIMHPGIYQGTPVTHLSGVWALDAAAIERVVSEGGGTMLLKQYTSFETICL